MTENLTDRRRVVPSLDMAFPRFGVAAVLITGFFLALVAQQNGRQPGVESHYHYRLGGEIAGGTIAPSPGDHLPLGALGTEHPVDHHWGFHVLIAPFTALGSWLNDDALGMQTATVCFAVASVLGLYYLIHAVGGTLGWLLCLLPLAFGTILWRLLQLRGGGVMAVGLLIWAFVAFKKARPVAAGITAALLMWAYHGAFLLIPLSCTALAGLWLLGAHRSPRIPPAILRACAASWLGVFVALILNPYGPKALAFLIYHLTSQFGDPLGFYTVGHEFSSFSLAALEHFPEYAIALAIALAVGGYCLHARRTLSEYTVAMIAMTGALTFLSWRSHRMVEYGLPFLALSLSLLCARPLRLKPRYQRLITAIVTCIIVLGIAKNTFETQEIIQHNTSPTNAYEPAAEILQKTPGIIGNLYQSDFALILWAAPNARCLQGLNHYFTHHDKEVALPLETLKRGAPPDEMREATEDLARKGVTLFTQRSRNGGHLRPFGEFAQSRPDLFRQVFGDENTFARIWEYKIPQEHPE